MILVEGAWVQRAVPGAGDAAGLPDGVEAPNALGTHEASRCGGERRGDLRFARHGGAFYTRSVDFQGADSPKTNCPLASDPARAIIGSMTPSEQITTEVTSWPGVTAGPGRRGEFAFKLGRKEIGHLHGDHAAHFFFPKDLWRELSGAGRVTEHPVFPGREGPAARRIATEQDMHDVIEMMRLNYDRIASGAQEARSARTVS